ncbi:odorant receptor 131-2-like [Dendrobates tinctorius]|uniref:odorant receptor 131-2-like n=1 Tax=Dendrobates tinctorius TaxID=92724 RepID=UPI003CC9A65F
MTNITNTQQNITLMVNKNNNEILRQTLLVITLLSFAIFIYIMAVMLMIFFTTSSAREQVRYILFAHMLITDLIYLLFSLFLFLVSFYPITFSVSFCYILVTVSSTSMKVTPYSLAIMSLERYIAICFPLRHGEFCTLPRTTIAIGVIWAIGLVPNLADFIVLILTVDSSFFLVQVRCVRTSLRFTEVQKAIKDFVYISTFSLVGLVIIFTYIRIMVVALKVGSGKASAFKAGKTVMLHAIQLLLCMAAFSYTIVEIVLKEYASLLPIINFCFFMCLPRFLSPFIYGIKDELFQKNMKKFVFCLAYKCDLGQIPRYNR